MILLVEDNENDASLISRILQKQVPDSTIHVAQDGEEALAFLEQADNASLRLVLLDLHLPRMSGLEVLRELRSHPHGRHVPVIVISGSRENQDVIASYDLGANSFLRKTVQCRQFEDTVRLIAPYWLNLNRPYATQGVLSR